AFLDGKLFARAADGVIVIADPVEGSDDALALTDPATGKSLGKAPADGLSKIGTNNSLRKSLKGLLAQTALTDPDPKLRLAAVKNISFWRSVYGGVETLFFGLSLGSVLVLAAIGLAITFGVMGVINMAHGELIMLGAYTAYVMQLLIPHNHGLALLLSVPAA